jgi:gluconokinase
MRHRLVVMGVAGSGKSTLGAQLANVLQTELIEGDDYHPASNVAKMAAGIALGDADRWPWLERLGQQLRDSRGNAVLSCSALKRPYRDLLRRMVPGLCVVYIEISPEKASERVGARAGHVFPGSLVASQFQALEPPRDEPDVFSVDARQPTATQVDAVLAWLTASRTSIFSS